MVQINIMLCRFLSQRDNISIEIYSNNTLADHRYVGSAYDLCCAMLRRRGVNEHVCIGACGYHASIAQTARCINASIVVCSRCRRIHLKRETRRLALRDHCALLPHWKHHTRCITICAITCARMHTVESNIVLTDCGVLLKVLVTSIYFGYHCTHNVNRFYSNGSNLIANDDAAHRSNVSCRAAV